MTMPPLETDAGRAPEHHTRRALLAVALLLALAACQREATAPAGPGSAPPLAGDNAALPGALQAELKDTVETTEGYVIGISYAPVINRHPGLAKLIREYDAGLRAELLEAVEAYGNDRPGVPYELSMSYDAVLDTPALVAIAADGSRYTGGAHGEPLVERFVWLATEERLLGAAELVPERAGWLAIGDYVQEQLHTASSVRADADRLEPEARARVVRDADEMIEEGTGPDPDNFSRFEPVVDAAGRITAVRFVFPPYQVAPYALGTQTVDVPAAVILPHVADRYRSLFATP